MIDYEALRELAALIAYPNTGQQRWIPSPVRTTQPPPPETPPRYTIQFCAEHLGVEPFTDDPDWRTHAKCKGTDAELFYPERGQPLGRPREVCGECPVRAECLAFALNMGEKFGIWGGLSERQRRPLRTQVVVEIQHGTSSGYWQHKKADESPCAVCRAAYNRRRWEANVARKGTTSAYTKGETA